MRIFVGCSGTSSEAIGLLLRDWLVDVIDRVELETAPPGDGLELARDLRSIQLGILCVTRDNLNDPWLHFQAGAVLRSVADRRYAALYLSGIDGHDLDAPLAAFEHVQADRDGTRHLLGLAARAAKESGAVHELAPFDQLWPALAAKLDELRGRGRGKPVVAPEDAVYGQPTTSDDRDAPPVVNHALEEAIEALQRSIAISPDNAVSHSRLGSLLYDAGRVDEAIEAFRRATDADPDQSLALSGLGAALVAKGNLGDAIPTLERAVAVSPRDPTPRHSLGNALRRAGRYAEAERILRQALELDPEDAGILADLAGAVRSQGDLDSAIDLLERAVFLDPGRATTHVNLGRMLRSRGDLERAIAAQRRAVELDPASAAAWKSLGTTLRRNGELDEAVDALHRAIQLNPDNTNAHNELAVTLLGLGKLQEAVAVLQQVVELLITTLEREPKNVAAYNELGVAYFHQGKLSQAIVALHRALEIDPDHPSIRKNLDRAIHAQEVRRTLAKDHHGDSYPAIE